MSAVDELELHRIIADGDMDGLFAAVVLKARFPNAEVRFSHPAEIRSGIIDHLIDRNTAICDLPFHDQCGLYLDHHATNRPPQDVEELFTLEGGICIWEDKPSAARVAWEHFRGADCLPSLGDAMGFVDRLDSGGLQLQELREGHPLLWFSRTIDARDGEYVHSVLNRLSQGMPLEELLHSTDVMSRCEQQSSAAERLNELISKKVEVIDRLAIMRMDGTGERTNGYALTAFVGEDCDACCIIHGWVDGDISTPDRPALSASFYCNSFLHPNGGIFDLTRMATLYDETGGGHHNACGCRIQPLSTDGDTENRSVESGDVERNLKGWLDVWSNRLSRSLE
ncbi:MAG: hypothetical protein QF707_03985 [Candidatus Poseidoniaceae archaeon]|jgi:hypothetical protein|nr:hypothetical protein [Candidatus Poseidoniaceae archaeon]MDP7202602.1 hypothetical protein [Candidatus Poseidoniaceae archaeon]|tara:strand:- start:55 stop:1071 length:1017 start_codon:yes stop_codon:yes gene_type:complete